jgi:hypothetical protein
VKGNLFVLGSKPWCLFCRETFPKCTKAGGPGEIICLQSADFVLTSVSVLFVDSGFRLKSQHSGVEKNVTRVINMKIKHDKRFKQL